MLSDSTGGTERSTASTAKLVGGLIVLGALVLFLLQNLQSTDIHFLWFTWSMGVIWALLGAAIGGSIVTITVQWFRRRAAARRMSASRTAG